MNKYKVDENYNYMVFTLCMSVCPVLRKQLVSRRFNKLVTPSGIPIITHPCGIEGEYHITSVDARHLGASLSEQ